MRCIKAGWISRCLGNYSFSPTVTLQDRKYHHHDVSTLPSSLLPFFLFVYIHGTDYVNQSDALTTQMTNLNFGLLTQLKALLRDCSLFVQSFSALRAMAAPFNDPNRCRIISHSDRCSATEHVGRCNPPHSFDIAGIIPRAKR